MQLALAADVKLVVVAFLLGLMVVDVGDMNYNMRGLCMAATTSLLLARPYKTPAGINLFVGTNYVGP